MMGNHGPAASKPPLAAEMAKKPDGPVTLEPIENYKGKSVEELEAILDAYNAQKPTQVVQHEATDDGPKPGTSGDQVQRKPVPAKRNRSQALTSKAEESKEALEPLKNS